MCSFTFTVFLSAFQLLPTAPFHIRELGGTTFASGLFLGFLTYASAFSAPLTGAIADRIGRRRTLLMLLLVGLPVLVALLGRIAEATLEVERILDPLGVRTILPLVALVFGTAALGSELEDGTAVFLIIKPIPRWRIIGAKMLVAAGLTIALIMPAMVATGIVAGEIGRAHV